MRMDADAIAVSVFFGRGAGDIEIYRWLAPGLVEVVALQSAGGGRG
ncbi:MAG: hypothetical protein U0401_14975 [Anaerolineae bacterium]